MSTRAYTCLANTSLRSQVTDDNDCLAAETTRMEHDGVCLCVCVCVCDVLSSIDVRMEFNS